MIGRIGLIREELNGSGDLTGLQALGAHSDLLGRIAIGNARGLEVGHPALVGARSAQLPLTTVVVPDVPAELRALAAD